MSFRIASLIILAADGLGHHVLLTSPLVTASYVGTLKPVHRTNAYTVVQMKQETQADVIRITSDPLHTAVASFDRLQTMMDA
jgi:hypothetical protein